MEVFTNPQLAAIMSQMPFETPEGAEMRTESIMPAFCEDESTECFAKLIWVCIHVLVRTAHKCISTDLLNMRPHSTNRIIKINNSSVSVSGNMHYVLSLIHLLEKNDKPWDIPTRHVPHKKEFRILQQKLIEGARDALEKMPSVNSITLTTQYANGNILPSTIKSDIYRGMNAFAHYLVSFIDKIEVFPNMPVGKCFNCKSEPTTASTVEITVDIDVHEDKETKRLLTRTFMLCPNERAHYVNLIRMAETKKRKLDNPAPTTKKPKRHKGLVQRDELAITSLQHKFLLLIDKNYLSE